MPDPIYGSDDDFAEGNASDPISGLQETPVDEFQHPTVVATASKLGHVKGGGNITIDADGTMRADIPDVATKIKRSITIANVCYCGTAPSGTAESATTWTLTKIVVAQDGTTTVTHATDSWINHLTANYI